MRLDARQVRFTQSFWPTWRTRTLRLGGRSGSLHLQEPALVIEGEFLRFRLFLGVEWLFRRALSEWTTVTVPYSRIVAVRQTWAQLIRILLVLAVVLSWIGAAAAYLAAPATDTATTIIVIVITVLFGFLAVRIKPTVKVVYRTKAGQRTQVTIWVRKRATRRAFVDALAAHREAAARFRPVVLEVA